MNTFSLNRRMLPALGGVLTLLALSACAPADNTAMDHSMNSDTAMDHGSLSMEDMMDELAGKTGDDFDRAFIEMMIPHHEGAIEMARAAQQSAGHQEIKDMAEDIISAQQSEIDMMRGWQRAWGYTE